jgi:hypothetical protein
VIQTEINKARGLCHICCTPRSEATFAAKSAGAESQSRHIEPGTPQLSVFHATSPAFSRPGEIGISFAAVDCEPVDYCKCGTPLRYRDAMARQIRTKLRILAEVGMIATALASCASLPSSIPEPKEVSTQTLVEHASADDCAIIGEIGKSEVEWSATSAPQAFFYPRFETPAGGTYIEDCPWKKLGLAEPRIGTPASPMAFFITRPAYSSTGASAYFQYSVGPVPTGNGKKIAPFIKEELCTLDKRAEGWHLIHCEMTVVS